MRAEHYQSERRLPPIIADACAEHGQPERRLPPTITDHSADRRHHSADYRRLSPTTAPTAATTAPTTADYHRPQRRLPPIITDRIADYHRPHRRLSPTASPTITDSIADTSHLSLISSRPSHSHFGTEPARFLGILRLLWHVVRPGGLDKESAMNRSQITVGLVGLAIGLLLGGLLSGRATAQGGPSFRRFEYTCQPAIERPGSPRAL